MVEKATACARSSGRCPNRYICDPTKGVLRITSGFESGGGADDPYQQSNKEHTALWNYDRLREPLPIIKACPVGKRKIVTVITKGCSARQGGGAPTVRLYVDPL